MSDTTSKPLAEADPKSLDMFFSMDPLDMSNTDIQTIVEELRRQRAQWAENEAKAAATGTTPRRAATPKPAPKPGASTMDLDALSAAILGRL